MDRQACEQAMIAKDPRFDGRFFIGVKTTGIYCRPVCPVKSPRITNVLFFPSAAAAAEAGFRPCLRCRPESSPGTPAWAGTSTTVSRGLRLIGEGALDDGCIEDLSERLGVTSRHLSRLFMQHLGASPKSIGQTRRLHFAKKLLDETSLPMTEIALAAGYGSVRRFNDHLLKVYGRSPTLLRGRSSISDSSAFRLRLPYRPPYDFDGVLDFLGVRAIPGVESVHEGRYERSISIEGDRGTIAVENVPDKHQLICEISLPGSRSLIRVVDRIRRLFDLNADPLEINCCLGRDHVLGEAIEKNPGRRVPGAWDPFEVAVRAIVGQQISVKGATTVMGKIVQTWGESDGEKWFFPAPEALAALDPNDLPMPRARAMAIRELAATVVDGRVNLSAEDTADMVAQLLCIKGIGPWTAQYVAMRAANDPDAFLHNDLVLLKVARHKYGINNDKELLALAEAWRPWRAYAGMHLWSMANELENTK